MFFCLCTLGFVNLELICWLSFSFSSQATFLLSEEALAMFKSEVSHSGLSTVNSVGLIFRAASCIFSVPLRIYSCLGCASISWCGTLRLAACPESTVPTSLDLQLLLCVVGHTCLDALLSVILEWCCEVLTIFSSYLAFFVYTFNPREFFYSFHLKVKEKEKLKKKKSPSPNTQMSLHRQTFVYIKQFWENDRTTDVTLSAQY